MYIDLINEDNFKDIEISDQKKFNKWVNLKGERRYRKIIDILKEHLDNIKDQHIYDLYRYDIRLRRNIIYYLTMFEVYLRASITNRFSINNLNQENFKEKIKSIFSNNTPQYWKEAISQIKTIIKKTNKDSLFEILEESTIYLPINLILCLELNVINNIFDTEYKVYSRFEMNLNAIRELRNKIFHHNIILKSELKECQLNNGFIDNSLKSNIINFKELLPKEFRSKFKKDVNTAYYKLLIPKDLIIEI